jgi:hypothetical protein
VCSKHSTFWLLLSGVVCGAANVTYCDVESIKRRKVLGHAIVDVHYFGQHVAARTVPRQGSLARPNSVVDATHVDNTQTTHTTDTTAKVKTTRNNNMQHKDERQTGANIDTHKRTRAKKGG